MKGSGVNDDNVVAVYLTSITIHGQTITNCPSCFCACKREIVQRRRSKVSLQSEDQVKPLPSDWLPRCISS